MPAVQQATAIGHPKQNELNDQISAGRLWYSFLLGPLVNVPFVAAEHTLKIM